MPVALTLGPLEEQFRSAQTDQEDDDENAGTLDMDDCDNEATESNDIDASSEDEIRWRWPHFGTMES